jgi:tyrosine-protein phosphatase YwqE
MIDLHCHLLPGIDDGAVDLAMALQMARIAAGDGITAVACTPHIYPGMYENDAAGIRAAVTAFQAELDAAGIALRLHAGADVHLDPRLVARIRDGEVPTLAGSRYLLLEPPHHVAPPRFEEAVFEQEGVRIYVDATSLALVDGTQIDLVKQRLGEQFLFRNPNASAECGCGESFTTDADAA